MRRIHSGARLRCGRHTDARPETTAHPLSTRRLKVLDIDEMMRSTVREQNTEWKPRPPSPRLRRVLRKTVPTHVYERYIGRHERMSLRVWRHLAARLPPGATVIDIGAFHGEYALAARAERHDLRILAFEPNPQSADRLRVNCCAANVEIVEAAVGEAPGRASFALSNETSGLHSVGRTSIEVDVMTLDQLALDNGALIKMDTEGEEAAILRAARRTLTLQRPIILCEVLSNARGACVQQLLPPGYALLKINEDHGLIPESSINRSKWRYKNWLFMPIGYVNTATTP